MKLNLGENKNTCPQTPSDPNVSPIMTYWKKKRESQINT
jgi:hypothetical protein